MKFLLVLNPPPPILRLNIANVAVAEGWLLLDIGLFVLFLFDVVIYSNNMFIERIVKLKLFSGCEMQFSINLISHNDHVSLKG